jgi:hypothetical protein
MAIGSVALVGGGSASGAARVSKFKITVKDCASASCQITMTIRAAIQETPTGTVTFLFDGSPIAANGGGSCFAEPVVPLTATSASVTCDATGLPTGRHKVSARYSGDNYFDPYWATKALTVKGASSG